MHPGAGQHHGARPAGRRALERDRTAAQATPGGLAGGIDQEDSDNAPDDFKAKVDEAFEVLMKVVA